MCEDVGAVDTRPVEFVRIAVFALSPHDRYIGVRLAKRLLKLERKRRHRADFHLRRPQIERLSYGASENRHSASFELQLCFVRQSLKVVFWLHSRKVAFISLAFGRPLRERALICLLAAIGDKQASGRRSAKMQVADCAFFLASGGRRNENFKWPIVFAL